MDDVIALSADGANASVALRGAEPLSWTVAGRELLWGGDPAHWSYHAPILFPVVGASIGGEVRVGGKAYPMPQHGIARTATFACIERTDASCRLRLVDGPDTRPHYPYGFSLDVTTRLAGESLALSFEVRNDSDGPMPYGLGFHPAFPWPLDGRNRDGHRVVFSEPERPLVPEVAAGGLLARHTRPIPLQGRELPLSPELFKEALVFLDANSRALRFVAASGAAIGMETDGFPHLAVWSRPTAPFLSLECWTAHADWEDADGELSSRVSMTILMPGETGRHRVRLTWHLPGGG